MITLESRHTAALDESARSFIETFVGHVAMIVGDDRRSMATIARVNVLLLAALSGRDSAASEWSLLHRTIAELIPHGDPAGYRRPAYDYLQSFIQENGDLARA